jgi:hypothetical protein
LPDSISLLRKRLRLRKLGVNISSFRCASQLSSSVSISSFSNVLCSGVSFATHFALSNLGVAGDVEEKPLATLPAGLEEFAPDFGPPKKEVMLASVFGFLACAGDEEGRLFALRFRGPPIGEDMINLNWEIMGFLKYKTGRQDGIDCEVSLEGLCDWKSTPYSNWVW